MLILGLDVSTSVCGVTLYDEKKKKHVFLDHIDFGDCETFWDKVDKARKYFDEFDYKPDVIGVEEAAMRFKTGSSSAGVLILLAKFNAIISLIVRDRFGLDPVYVSANEARKLCGLTMHKAKKCGGKNHKQQTFDAITSTDLKEHVFPLTPRSKKIVGWAKDIVDSFVVAKAVSIIAKRNN